MSGTQTENKLPDLPPSTLTIENGQVQVVEEWTMWNGQPWCTVRIERIGHNLFRSAIGDPEHGGGGARGTIEKVTEGLHNNFVAWYRYLFSLVELNDSISQPQLARYELRFVPAAKAA